MPDMTVRHNSYYYYYYYYRKKPVLNRSSFDVWQLFQALLVSDTINELWKL